MIGGKLISVELVVVLVAFVITGVEVIFVLFKGVKVGVINSEGVVEGVIGLEVFIKLAICVTSAVDNPENCSVSNRVVDPHNGLQAESERKQKIKVVRIITERCKFKMYFISRLYHLEKLGVALLQSNQK